jgi:hypothetical protein
MSRKALIAPAVAALATAAVIGAMSAVAGTASNARPQGNLLLGTWQSTVALPAPAPTVHSLQMYSPGGGWVETSDTDPRTRSPMFGSWERIHSQLYAVTGLHYIFDPQTGAYTGKRKIDRTLEVSADGQSYSNVARVTTFDTHGNVVSTFTVHGTGERVPVDRIPDQP